MHSRADNSLLLPQGLDQQAHGWVNAALIQSDFSSCKVGKRCLVVSFISEAWSEKVADEKKGLEFIANIFSNKITLFINGEGLVSSMPQ